MSASDDERPRLALVLHAHLPFVRHPELERSLEERWFFEALWECYLPLAELCQRAPPHSLTVSLSPSLLAMFRDGLLARRFERHLDELEALNHEVITRSNGGELEAVAQFYATRLERARASWKTLGGDLGAAFSRARDRGTIELWTTAATHAFLPALCPVPGAVNAQLELGRAYFRRCLGFEPDGLWLPECGFSPPIDGELARNGVRVSVLDAHGVDTPGVAHAGHHGPIRSAAGVAYFPRHTAACHAVWSREHGYPGDPVYREFFADIGLAWRDDALGPWAAPDGARAMTGLKYWRITGPGDQPKRPYERGPAATRARGHAALFVGERLREMAPLRTTNGAAPALCLAAFDAELFGHFWFEGPEFLAAVLDSCAREGLGLTTPRAFLAERGGVARAMPTTSTWGQGGHAAAWLGPESARHVRHVHAAHRRLSRALANHAGASGEVGRALDQAIRELLLLEASDWSFLVGRGPGADYARERFARHHRRVIGLLDGVERGRVPGPLLTMCVEQDPLFAELGSDELRSAFADHPNRRPPGSALS